MSFLKQYGIYTIPKGIKLFRQAADSNIYKTMFFGFSTTAITTASIKPDVYQVWETKESFDSLFMVKGKKPAGYPVSAIEDIYKHYFPNDINEYSYLTLKINDSIERRRIISTLKSHNFNSWVTSLHNTKEMELFIFRSKKHNASLVKLVDIIDKKDCGKISSIDTFDYSKINDLPIIVTPIHKTDYLMPFNPLLT